MWDAGGLTSFELPLVNAGRSAQHATPGYYYASPSGRFTRAIRSTCRVRSRPATCSGSRTSNTLTPALGFTVLADHLKRYGIINRSVGTDPELALRTRKGTGYYKVPSLKGVWYRGPFQHAGAVRTLEEWFDPARLDKVPGHRFGLTLTPDDRRALIAFIKTL